MAKFTKIGSIRKSKQADKDNYIVIDADVVLKKGSVIQVQDPRKRLDKSVANNKLSAEAAAEIKEKIPQWLLRELVLIED